MEHFTFRTILTLLMICVSSTSVGQSGPLVPCANCESRLAATFPTSGPWANTDQTGSGFLLQIQNGVLAGFYFGYDVAGNPEWLLLNGTLEPGAPGSDILWQLETNLSRFAGGSCPSCEYAAPDIQEAVGIVHLKFYQRNHASFQIDSNPEQYIVPLLYGSAGFNHFAEHSDYLLPELDGDGEGGTPWLISLYKGPPLEQNLLYSVTVHFESSEVTHSEEDGTKVEFRSIEKFAPIDPEPPAVRIHCSDTNGSGEIGCTAVVALLNYWDVFHMPLANVGPNRFVGENEEGETIEGFRLGYD